MNYVSTRDKKLSVSAAKAIATGIAPDGGLYCPTEITALCKKNYRGRSADILGRFLTDFTAEELEQFAARAYADEKFGGSDTAPLVKLEDGTYILELWHGPTCAFKDMALQMLPHLLTASLKKTGEQRTACILVATSGDTGKAAGRRCQHDSEAADGHPARQQRTGMRDSRQFRRCAERSQENLHG